MVKDKKHLYWVVGLVIITILLCSTLIWLNYNSWTIRFEMDDNTKEAIESIEFDKINDDENIVHVCTIFKNGTADCGRGDGIDPDVIEIYGDCEYKFKWDEDFKENTIKKWAKWGVEE